MIHAAVAACDDLAGDDVDAALLDHLARIGAPFAGRPLAAAAPSFRAYAADDLVFADDAAFPAFSITGAGCALGCAHCGGRILAPMIAATRPELLEAELHRRAAGGRLRGFLLSGGSDRANRVRFEPFLPVVARVRRELGLRVAVHTGLVDASRAAALAAAGVDVAMLDIIGDAATIRDIYRLDAAPAAFEAALAHLVAAGLTVVPHIVVGLHFGALRGEDAALAMIARHRTAAAILVVLMPHLTEPGFAPVDPAAAGAFFGRARQALADRRLALGCARPAARARTLLDLYAVAAGFDAIAHPAAGIATLARRLGRRVDPDRRCCALACAA